MVQVPAADVTNLAASKAQVQETGAWYGENWPPSLSILTFMAH
jgi:hypothetical protein